MKNEIATALGVVLALTATPPQAWGTGLVPAAGEILANSFTGGEQGNPNVAVHSNGSFVVVWADNYAHDGNSFGVFGQRFNSDGTPTGSEFQINTATIAVQRSPDVTFVANGGFIVVWTANSNIGGQRFSSAGAAIGTEFTVNIPGPGFIGSHGIAADTSGGFVVVWSDASGRDGDGFGVFGRRFNSIANPVAGEFQINTYTLSDQAFQHRGAIATDASGAFTVAWQSMGQDGSADGVFAQRFTPTGNKNDSEFSVNTYTPGFQRSTALAASPNGDFVITWLGYPGVFAQRFASSGAPIGNELQVNSYTEGSQGFQVDVAAAANGDFVVVWEAGDDQDGSEFGVFGKLISASGDDITPDLQVNSFTFDNQRRPAIGSSPDGNFVVAWQSFQQDGTNYGVFAQRLVPSGECRSAPVAGCRTSEKSLLLMKQPNSGNDKLIWKFLKGAATAEDDFGDPTDDTDYALCVYAGTTDTLINELRVPADAGKWGPLGTKGFKYNDPGKTADGVQKILLSGGAQGKAKAKVKGKDANLPDPTLGSLPAPVTAQLVRSGSLTCWEATYQSSDFIDNDADTFKAKFSN